MLVVEEKLILCRRLLTLLDPNKLNSEIKSERHLLTELGARSNLLPEKSQVFERIDGFVEKLWVFGHFEAAHKLKKCLDRLQEFLDQESVSSLHLLLELALVETYKKKTLQPRIEQQAAKAQEIENVALVASLISDLSFDYSSSSDDTSNVEASQSITPVDFAYITSESDYSTLDLELSRVSLTKVIAAQYWSKANCFNNFKAKCNLFGDDSRELQSQVIQELLLAFAGLNNLVFYNNQISFLNLLENKSLYSWVGYLNMILPFITVYNKWNQRFVEPFENYYKNLVCEVVKAKTALYNQGFQKYQEALFFDTNPLSKSISPSLVDFYVYISRMLQHLMIFEHDFFEKLEYSTQFGIDFINFMEKSEKVYKDDFEIWLQEIKAPIISHYFKDLAVKILQKSNYHLPNFLKIYQSQLIELEASLALSNGLLAMDKIRDLGKRTSLYEIQFMFKDSIDDLLNQSLFHIFQQKEILDVLNALYQELKSNSELHSQWLEQQDLKSIPWYLKFNILAKEKQMKIRMSRDCTIVFNFSQILEQIIPNKYLQLYSDLCRQSTILEISLFKLKTQIKKELECKHMSMFKININIYKCYYYCSAILREIEMNLKIHIHQVLNLFNDNQMLLYQKKIKILQLFEVLSKLLCRKDIHCIIDGLQDFVEGNVELCSHIFTALEPLDYTL